MNRILKAVSPLFLALLAVSCSDDDMVDMKSTDAGYAWDTDEVNFEINVYAGEDPGAGSRSSRDSQDDPTWGGDFFYPEDLYRSTEAMHTLRVIIVRPSGEIEANEYISRLPEAGVNEFRGIRVKVVGGETKTVYLFANEASITPYSHVADPRSPYYSKPLDLSAYEFHVGQIFPTSDIKAMRLNSNKPGEPVIDNTATGEKLNIPMSECFVVDVKAPEKEEDHFQSADLFITRTLSKFTFTLASPVTPFADYAIEEIRISSLGHNVFLLPNNTEYSPAKYPTSFEPRYITSYSVPTEYENAPFIFKPAGDLTLTPDYVPGEVRTYSPELYFAETKLSDGKQVYKISVKFAGDPDYYVTDLPLPNLPSLPRNTHVKINLTLNDTGLHPEVVLLPYTGVDLAPDFGL